MVHLGDPHGDLVYVLGGLWRSPPPGNWVCHLLPEEEFLSKYEERSGIKVERERLVYYEILNDLKALGIMTTAIHSFASHKSDDLKPGVFGTLLDLANTSLVQHLSKQMEA